MHENPVSENIENHDAHKNADIPDKHHVDEIDV